MFIVGLTGGIGSGKTVVASMLAERGAEVLDADVFAREAIAPGTPGYVRVLEAFGPHVVTPDGGLDRAKLADLVFHDDDMRLQLEEIVHPEVQRRIAEGVERFAGTDRVVVVESPLLFETGADERFPTVVVVDAPVESRVSRLVERGMTEEDARARIASQLPLEMKVQNADLVVDNAGTREDLAREVDRLWIELDRRRKA